ncbi:MAG: AAA family ATPase [Lawsonella clevelandensis]
MAQHNFIPCRSLTLLAGREGIGKSLIACDYVAQATRGELDNGEPLNCLYLHTEDSRSATVTPRIRAAGADMERVFFLDVTVSYENREIGAALRAPRDFEALEQVIKDKHVGVVVLDAAKSSMSAKIDGNRDDSVRQVLDPMNRMGDETNCAFIGLVHFGKRESSDTGKLITGSIAWSQVARSVLSVAKDEEKIFLSQTRNTTSPMLRSQKWLTLSLPLL